MGGNVGIFRYISLRNLPAEIVQQRVLNMAIQVKYFASLRDQLGRGEDALAPTEGFTVGQVWSTLWPDRTLPPNTLTAVNQEYADLNRTVQDGDEVAFFPPVTGG
jgi:molybdopterin synthase sulfur carrier subunit